MQNLTFSTGYQKESKKDYLYTNEVTPKSMIPGASLKSLHTENTELGNHRDAQINETIYRGVGGSVSAQMSTEQILNATELNWEVTKQPAYFQDQNQKFHKIEKFYSVIRKDNNQLLSGGDLASDNWTIYQNHEVVETFKNFCNEGGLELEQVGSLKDGEIIFATAKINESFQLTGNDAVTGKLILTNSHRPGTGVKVNLMALRKVCTNGLVMPVKTNGVIIRHNINLANVVPQVLASAKNGFRQFEENSVKLTQTPITKEEAMAILIKTFGNPAKELDEQPRVVRYVLDSFINKKDEGAEMLSAYNTAWGLLNSTTSYFNHTSVASNSAKQLNSLWLGTKANHQKKIYSELVSVAQRAF